MTSATRRRIAFLALFLGASAMAGAAFAYWSSTNSANPAAAGADSILAGSTPVLGGVNGQDVTLSWAASTTSSAAAVSGYTVARYSVSVGGAPTPATGGCAGTVTALTCTEQAVPGATWYYAVTPRISLWAGAESGRLSVPVVAGAFSVTSSQIVKTPGTVAGGSISHFKNGESVTFRLDTPTGTLLGASVTAVDSSGAVSGFTVTVPSGPSDGSHTIVAVGAGGSQATSNSFSVDTTAPSGGSVSYTNGYVTSASVAVTFTNGTDGGSGVNSATTQLTRASASLTNGTCGTFGSFTGVGNAGASSPATDTSVLSGNCYQYQYQVADNLGNTATYSSASVVKVDTSGPTFSLTSSGANVSVTGMTAYFKSLGTGSFTVTASDAQSGVTSSTFPAAPTGWTVSGSGNARTYALGAASVSSSILVSATNGAGTASGSQTVTITVDATVPTATAAAVAPISNTTTQGFIQQGGQYYVYVAASDTGSGLATVTVNVSTISTGQTAVALVAGSYTAFGTTYNYRSAAITATNPLAAGAKSYTGTLTDAVGNAVTPASSSVTVDNTAPTGSITAPATWATASTTVTASSADVTAGVASAQFQYSPAGAGSWTTIATDTVTPYSVTWDTTALTNGGSYDLRVITTDNAANTFTSPTVTVIVDRIAPNAPSTPVLAPASDSGVAGDSITKVTTPSFTGTAEAGATVKLFDGVTQIGSGTATGGAWSIVSSTLASGAHMITATATDAAGNVSAASSSVTVTIDTAAPATSLVKLADGPGTAGTADAGDTATVTFSEQLNPATLCSTWTGSGVQSLTNATVTITNAGATDGLTVTSASCTTNLGSMTLGDYVSATATFTNSTITWDPTAKTLTVTLGTFSSGTLRTGVTNVKQKYTAVAAVTDLAGNAMPTTTFTDAANTGF